MRNLMRGRHVASPTRYGRPRGGSPDHKIEETTMSWTFTALAATLAFTAVVATGSIAEAQSGMGAPMQQSPSGSMSGSDMTGSTPPMHAREHRGLRQERRAMRQERRATRRQMRAERRAENDPDGAFMGGGGVYERMPDGSLRPVR
jgi:hypothetical protein